MFSVIKLGLVHPALDFTSLIQFNDITAGLLILSIQQVGRFGHMPDFRINQLGRVKLNFIILVLLSIFFDMFEIGKVCCWMTLWVLATSCGFV